MEGTEGCIEKLEEDNKELEILRVLDMGCSFLGIISGPCKLQKQA